MIFKRLSGPAAVLIGWALGCAGWSGVAGAAMFTAGDLAVVRVGDGSAALTNAATAVFVDEYNPVTGALVQSIALPPTGATAFTNSGTATSEGALTLSSDGRYLALAGYNAAAGTAAVVGTASTAVAREVAVVDVTTGMVNNSTQFTSAFSANNIRGAVVVSNSAGQPGTIYAVGANSGVQSIAYGTSGASTTISSSTPTTNLRTVNIFNGQLYVTSGSSTAIGLNTVGAGTPTTSNQPLTLVASDATSAGGGNSPYGFVILGNNLYIADSTAGALLKYVASGNSYNLLSTTTIGAGLTGLTGSVVNGVDVLYASDPNALFRIVDNGTTPITSTSFATVGTNEAFRGIALIPAVQPSAVPEPASVVLVGLGLVGTVVAARRRHA